MKGEPIILSAGYVSLVRRAAIIGFGVAGLAIAISALRLYQAKNQLAELSDQLKLQGQTLANLRQSTKASPSAPKSTNQDTVGRIQSTIETAARRNGCRMNEFQASPDRSPYICAFTLESTHQDWEQVQVHVTLHGRLGGALSTLDVLRDSGLAVEPDSIEITRSDSDRQGIANIDLHIVFRALLTPGGSA